MGKFFKTAGAEKEVFKLLRKMRTLHENVRKEKDAKKLLKFKKKWVSKVDKLSKKYGKEKVEGIAEKFVRNSGAYGSRGKLVNRRGDTISKARGDGRGLQSKLVKGGWLPG